MSNNCAVTLDSGEIGRMRALQALACGLELDASFNPVPLKPGLDHISRVVAKGKANERVSAPTYRLWGKVPRGIVAETSEELWGQFDAVLREDVGNPAGVNLRESDITGMGLAELADLPVVVVGSIDRGGVLTHFVGTYAILSPEDCAWIIGFIVNKFRGDVSLLTPGSGVVREHTGVPVLGIAPLIPGLRVDAEDSLGTVAGVSVGPVDTPLGMETLLVTAIRLPRVSNAADIEALACEPGIHIQRIVDPSAAAYTDLVVLPGTKLAVTDLKWLYDRGLDDTLKSRAARELLPIGICSGFQVLCATITGTVELAAGAANGLGVSNTDIEFTKTKTLAGYLDGSHEVRDEQVMRNSEAPFITKPEEGGA